MAETAKDKATAAVESAIKKAAQLEARRMLAEMAEKQKAANAKRRDDNRRRYLLGSWVMQAMKTGNMDGNSVKTALAGYLTRPDDRALFDLPPKPEGAK